MCMNYLDDTEIVSEIRELVNGFEKSADDASEYVEFMKKMFLSCSCQNWNNFEKEPMA